MKNFTLIFSSLLLIVFANSCKKLNTDPYPKPPIDSLKIGLLAYYPFNGNTYDGSGNNLNGFGYNLISITGPNGAPKSAYAFNGISSYMVTTDVPRLRLSNTDFTINTWIKLNSYNQSYRAEILSKRYTGNEQGYDFSINGYANQPAATLGTVNFGVGGTSQGGTSNSALDLNKWYMVTVVYTVANHQLTFYKDGVFDGSSTANVASPNGTIQAPLYVGKDNPSNNTGYVLDGALGDWRIYIRALKTKEITALSTGAH